MLVLEVAPELFEEAPAGSGSAPRPEVIRASVFFGGRESIGVAEVEVMRDLCQAIAGRSRRYPPRATSDRWAEKEDEMTAYFIANLKIHDEDGMGKYLEAFGPNFAKFEGKVLAADGEPQKTEGEWPYNRTVILEFPSKEEALRWYNDPEYQEIAKLRHAASDGDVAVIMGFE